MDNISTFVAQCFSWRKINLLSSFSNIRAQEYNVVRHLTRAGNDVTEPVLTGYSSSLSKVTEPVSDKKDFLRKLGYNPSKPAELIVIFADKPNEEIKVGINSRKTLTENLLTIFKYQDEKKNRSRNKDKNKKKFCDIIKITLYQQGSNKHTLYFPKYKQTAPEITRFFFEQPPVQFSEILATPDDYQDKSIYREISSGLHITQQENVSASGKACIFMIANDMKLSNNISEEILCNIDTIDMSIHCFDDVENYMSILSPYKINVALVSDMNKHRYIFNKIRAGKWDGIIETETEYHKTHFFLITCRKINSFFIRDPFQGIISCESVRRIKQLAISNVIEINGKPTNAEAERTIRYTVPC